MDRETLDGWCEKGILGLVLCILVFSPIATGTVTALEFLAVQGMTMGILTLWAIRFWTRKSYRLLWPPVCWAVLAFTLYTVFCYSKAPIEYSARHELGRVVVYAILFFAILDNLNRQEWTQLISLVLIFLGMAIAMYAIVQFLTQSTHILWFEKPAQYKGRSSGTFICPNHLAGFLEMIFPIAIGFVFLGRFKAVTKVFCGYACLVMLAGIGVTVSRAGWIITLFIIIVIFTILARNKNYRIPALVALAVLVVIGVYAAGKSRGLQDRFKQLAAEKEEPLIENFRTAIWRPSLDLWKKHFWTGTGPAQYDFAVREFRPRTIQSRPIYAHNDYLNTLADYGLIGLLLVISALALVFYGLYSSRKFLIRTNELSTRPSNRSGFIFGASLAVLALILHSIIDFNMQIPANAILLISLLALISGHIRFATERFWFNIGTTGRAVGSVACAALTVWLAQTILHNGTEQYWLNKASKAIVGSDRQVMFLKKAFEVEPNNFATAYAVGEWYRLHSWDALADSEKSALEAIEWFKKVAQLNPLDGYPHLRWGMCLDWLKKFDESPAHYQLAQERDRNNYFIAAHIGWHYFQIGNYQKAFDWFWESLHLNAGEDNIIPRNYLQIVDKRLKDPSYAIASLKEDKEIVPPAKR